MDTLHVSIEIFKKRRRNAAQPVTGISSTGTEG